MSVELQETLRVLRFRGGALGCAVHVQPGYHADLARLLVTDYQHVLFVFFFFLPSEKCFNGLFMKEIMDTSLVEGYIFLLKSLIWLERNVSTSSSL